MNYIEDFHTKYSWKSLMSYNGVEIVSEAKQIEAEIIKYGCKLLDSRLIVGAWGTLVREYQIPTMSRLHHQVKIIVHYH